MREKKLEQFWNSRPAKPIPDDLLHRIAIIFGTSELHVARDYHSFTAMLDTVIRSNHLCLPFVEISGKVNENWRQQNIKQKSKEDMVKIGNNWKDFRWPSKDPILPGYFFIFLLSVLYLIHLRSFEKSYWPYSWWNSESSLSRGW